MIGSENDSLMWPSGQFCENRGKRMRKKNDEIDLPTTNELCLVSPTTGPLEDNTNIQIVFFSRLLLLSVHYHPDQTTGRFRDLQQKIESNYMDYTNKPPKVTLTG
jgi:hypothetical protein